jgi:hypothetical protein
VNSRKDISVSDAKSSSAKMLLICFTMEQILFRDYESRLRFDDRLLQMRAEFEHRKEQLRKELIVRLKVPPPAARVASR